MKVFRNKIALIAAVLYLGVGPVALLVNSSLTSNRIKNYKSDTVLQYLMGK